MKPTTVSLVLSIALSKGWELRQVDINNTFLNGDLQEVVYMEQPRGFVDSSRPSHVCRLHKALYGLKQTPRAWLTKLEIYLLRCGFRSCHSDPSLFVLTTSHSLTFVLVYVDDIIITGSNRPGIQKFIQALDATFRLKDLGYLSFFLGIEVTYSADSIYLSQYKYTRDLLARCTMLDAKPISSLAGPISKNDKSNVVLADITTYRQIVGSLQYAMITRPEISYAANQACQHMHCLTHANWQDVKRILRYLKGSIDHGLKFQSSSSVDLVAYSDAGWMSDPANLRSQHGYAIFYGRNLISWAF